MSVIEKSGALDSGLSSPQQPPSLTTRPAPPPPPPGGSFMHSGPPPPPSINNGPPPPPPPSMNNGPPPPPPSMNNGPPPPPLPSTSSGSDSGGRSALLESIQRGKTLKHVDPNEPLPNSSNLSTNPPSGLAETLARAMELRRNAIKEDVQEDENDSDGDWSDE
jgi:hypothetical protein